MQIKGIAELLEGLLPYSQRHFIRVDRFVRSTFLLDYTLTGMSVVEPETSAEDGSKSKKRKSDKQKEDRTHKKVAYTSVAVAS